MATVHYHTMQLSLDIICQTTKIKCRTTQPMWFDGELRQEIRCKNNLYKIIKAQESTDKSIWTDFKKGKIAVRKLLVCERREYIISTLDENKNDLKKFWKEPNSNINIGKSKTSTNITAQVGGRIVSGLDAAVAMNEYYSTIGSNMASKFTHCINMTMKSTNLRPKDLCFFQCTKEVTSFS